MGLQVSQMAPAALHFNIKLPECCFLIPSAVKIIHIIAHGGKLAPQNHKSQVSPHVLSQRRQQQEEIDLIYIFYFPFSINITMFKC